MNTTIPTEISRSRAIQYLWNETDGLVFSAQFIKSNGSLRKMTCRRGVKKHLAGGDLPYDPKPRRLLPVFDMLLRSENPRDNYRMVNLGTLVGFKIHGTNYIITKEID